MDNNNKKEFNQEACDIHMEKFCRAAAQNGFVPREAIVARGLDLMLEELNEFMLWREQKVKDKP